MIELNLAFIIQLINFCILVLILNQFLFKPIRKVMADRRRVIDEARTATVSVDREVEEKMALYESRLHETRTEAASRKAILIRQAQEEETALLEQARREAAATLETIRTDLARETATARETLKEHARNLSDDICGKILGRSLRP